MNYDSKRRIYLYRVKKARKDNPAVTKGQPYIRVKRDPYSNLEYFRGDEHLDKKYPVITFREKHSYTLKLLAAYKMQLEKNSNLTPYRFLKNKYDGKS